MKAFLALAVAIAAVAPAQAEIFRPNAGHGSPRNESRDRGPARPTHSSYGHGGYVYRHQPSLYWGFGPAYYPAYGYYGYYPGYAYYPGYGADYPYSGNWGYYGSSSAASSGFWLGALAGGIIGNNSGSLGHNAWRGAAWGAGAGWLLGTIADVNRRTNYAPAATAIAAPPAQTASAAPAAAPQQVTIINNYYNSSPMSGANSLFGR